MSDNSLAKVKLRKNLIRGVIALCVLIVVVKLCYEAFRPGQHELLRITLLILALVSGATVILVLCKGKSYTNRTGFIIAWTVSAFCSSFLLRANRDSVSSALADSFLNVIFLAFIGLSIVWADRRSKGNAT